MTPVVQAAASCALLLLSSEIEPTPTGWIEHSRLELGAVDDDCDAVRIPLPSGVHLGTLNRATERLGDGIKRKLDASAFEVEPRSLRGEASVVVHLPDLLSGDRVEVRWERVWDVQAPLEWSLPAGIRHSELISSATARPLGDVAQGKHGYWVSESTTADGVVLTAPGCETPQVDPDALRIGPSHPPTIHRALTLDIPSGDPQLVLYPGGGSSLVTRLSLDFQAEDRDRSWMVHLGPGKGPPQVLVEPSEDAASWTLRDDDLLLTVAGSEGPARIAIAWEQPDAPTYGEPLPGETLTVEVKDGLVVTDRNGAWFLAGVHDRPVIPARSALVRGLDRRFRNHAIPEPGLPASLRGVPASWDLAAAIPDALRERVEVQDLGTDPLWVRKLVKARKTGGVTPTEAGIIAWLFATQGQLEAKWALVRPAPSGPGGDASPSGYSQVLVQIRHEGEERWLDPACASCAPFEIRPELEGSDALGWEIERTPDPTPGRWTAAYGPDWVRWELEGSAALELRRWAQGAATSERYGALAARMAGPGAELVQVEGLDRPGDRITLAAKGGSGVRADPLSLPVAAPTGAWVDWIGTREAYRTDGGGHEGSAQTPNLTYQAHRDAEGVLVERLEIRSRQLTAEDLATLLQARSGPAEPDPTDGG